MICLFIDFIIWKYFLLLCILPRICVFPLVISWFLCLLYNTLNYLRKQRPLHHERAKVSYINVTLYVYYQMFYCHLNKMGNCVFFLKNSWFYFNQISLIIFWGWGDGGRFSQIRSWQYNKILSRKFLY